MGAFKSAVITTKGQALLAKAVLNIADLEFTKIAVSENKLSGNLVSLTGIGTVKQSVKVASVKRTNNSSVKVSASIANNDLTSGYYVRNIGLYAKDPDEGEILYSISVADESNATADWMPPYNGVGVSSLMIDLITVVGNSDNVKVEVDPTAFATVAQISEVNDHLKALENTITTTTEKTLKGSVAGGLKINKIFGNSEQVTTTGAQLLDATAMDNVYNVSGITFNMLEGGGFYVNGAKGADNWQPSADKLITLEKGTYVLSYKGSLGSLARIRVIDNSGKSLDYGNNAPFTINGTEKSVTFIIQLDPSKTVNDTIYPMLNKGTEALPWEPYTNRVASPTPEYPQEIRDAVVNMVTARGKNLCNTVVADKTTYQGITYAVGNDGNITLNGTANDSLWYKLATAILEAGKTYVLSGNSALNLSLWDHTLNVAVKVKPINTSEVTFTPITSGVHSVNVNNVKDTSFSSISADIMIRHANITDSAYEPYTESVCTLPDAIPLKAIPVTSKKYATYTDENGKMWCADYVDTKRKVLVKRIHQYVSTGLEELIEASNKRYYFILQAYGNPKCIDNYLEANALCSHFRVSDASTLHAKTNMVAVNGENAYLKFTDTSSVDDIKAVLSEGIVFDYILANPIETPLTDADLLAFKSLYCYDGVTHIGTPAGVEPIVEVEYGTNKVGAMLLEIYNAINISGGGTSGGGGEFYVVSDGELTSHAVNPSKSYAGAHTVGSYSYGYSGHTASVDGKIEASVSFDTNGAKFADVHVRVNNADVGSSKVTVTGYKGSVATELVNESTNADYINTIDISAYDSVTVAVRKSWTADDNGWIRSGIKTVYVHS